MSNFNVDFEEVVYIMGLASAAKVKACITSVEWNKVAVSDALNKSEFGVPAIIAMTPNNKLESVIFDCVVRFKANEVPGIVAQFACNMSIVASFNQLTRKYHFTVFHGPKYMGSATDSKACYSVEWLHTVFSKKKPSLDIRNFVSRDFNFASLCKAYRDDGNETDELRQPQLL